MTLLALIALVTATAVGIAAGIGRLVPRLRELDSRARIAVPLTALVATASVTALLMAETLDRGADTALAPPGETPRSASPSSRSRRS